MKRALLLVLPFAALPLPVVPLSGQQTFEGTVTYKMNVQGQSIDMVHHIKGQNTRIEMNIGGQSFILLTDAEATKQIMLMPATKQWMDMKAMQERMAAMRGGRGMAGAEREELDLDSIGFRATGQTETVAGHECEHYILTAEGNQVDICAAKGLGWYTGTAPGAMAGMTPMRGGRGGGMMGGGQSVPGLSSAQLEKLRERFADGFFPLKVSSATQGSIVVNLEATKIEKKTLDDALFVPPSDYTEMRMGGGGRPD